MPSKSDMLPLEKSQEQFSNWILPSLLPLNYYIVLTYRLLLSKLVNNYYAFNIIEHVNIAQRQSIIGLCFLNSNRNFSIIIFSIEPQTEQTALIQVLIHFRQSDSKIEY